jgi:hypothetical protein
MPSAVEPTIDLNGHQFEPQNGVQQKSLPQNGFHGSSNGTENGTQNGTSRELSEAELAGEVSRYPDSGINVLMYVSHRRLLCVI